MTDATNTEFVTLTEGLDEPINAYDPTAKDGSGPLLMRLNTRDTFNDAVLELLRLSVTAKEYKSLTIGTASQTRHFTKNMKKYVEAVNDWSTESLEDDED